MSHRPGQPDDEVNDLLRRIHRGDTKDVAEEGGAPTAEVAAPAAGEYMAPTPTISAPPISAPDVPDIITRVLGSPRGEELLAVAHSLDPDKSRRVLVFHLREGNIQANILWCNVPQHGLSEWDSLILCTLRDPPFVPRPGAEIRISFKGGHGESKVVVLAEPMQLYPSCGVDLLAFLPHDPSMEKDGKLSEGAPSAVSGEPSTTVDPDGEPVVEGEKSAAIDTVGIDDAPQFEPRD